MKEISIRNVPEVNSIHAIVASLMYNSVHINFHLKRFSVIEDMPFPSFSPQLLSYLLLEFHLQLQVGTW